MAKVVQNQQNSKFSKDRTYRWEPTDLFEITGQQFASLFHALSQEYSERGGASMQLKYEAYQVVMEILKRGVEQGVIVDNEETVNADVQKGVKALFPAQSE